jgi:hypothetical protein
MTRQGIRALIVTAVGMASFAFCDTGGAAVQLQLKLPQGKTYYAKSTFDQHITQTVMNQQQVIDQSIGMGLKWDVLEVDSQGNMRIRQTFIWAAYQQTNPMGSVEYDSAKQATPTAGAEPFAALLGQGFVVKLSPKGDVLDVNGVEEMRAAVLKKLPPGADQRPEMSAVAMYLDKNSVKEMLGANLAVYPDKPVEVGQSWSKKQTVKLGFGIITDSKWTLQKREDGMDIIATTATLRSDPSSPPMETAGMTMKFDITGTAEGTLRVEEATGLIRLDQSRQQLKGNIDVGPAGQAGSTMTIPAVFDTTSKMEMSDKPFMPAAAPASGAPATR